jgi:hypothetical protein
VRGARRKEERKQELCLVCPLSQLQEGRFHKVYRNIQECFLGYDILKERKVQELRQTEFSELSLN